MTNFYEILGVNSNAPKEVIEASFNVLLNKHMLDQKILEQLRLSYETLGDDGKRQTYDEMMGFIKNDSSDKVGVTRQYEEKAEGVAHSEKSGKPSENKSIYIPVVLKMLILCTATNVILYTLYNIKYIDYLFPSPLEFLATMLGSATIPAIVGYVITTLNVSNKVGYFSAFVLCVFIFFNNPDNDVVKKSALALSSAVTTATTSVPHYSSQPYRGFKV